MARTTRTDPAETRRLVLQAGLVPERLPRHVAVIMDGNGRWAKARGLPHAAGHRAGTEALRRLLEASAQLGIPYLTIYAFSTENWKRSPREVRALMFLVEDVIQHQLDELDEKGVRILHVGWMEGVPKHLVSGIQRAVERTAGNDLLTLAVAFNYGSRQELARAARRIVEEGIPASEVDEHCVARHLETWGLPDPDLIIRTSGEMRLSNFLLWQAAYSEFYCTDTLWPDFNKSTLVAALDDYGRRERRFGGRLQDSDVEAAVSEGPPVPSPGSPAA
jgi:undecaprenyl diphosphate synthase